MARKNVQVGEMEEREVQDQGCVQIAVSCNAGIGNVIEIVEFCCGVSRIVRLLVAEKM